MMLMKTPTAGTSATGTGGRDVIFRLSVQPSPDAPAKLRTWGETMRREQALFSTDGKRVAAEWGNAWAAEFDKLAARSRTTAAKVASDWQAAMRGFGAGPGGPAAAGIRECADRPDEYGGVGDGQRSELDGRRRACSQRRRQ